MIFHTEKRADFIARCEKWHRWFAWYPASWDGGWAWFSYVERRLYFRVEDMNFWEYRAAPLKKEAA